MSQCTRRLVFAGVEGEICHIAVDRNKWHVSDQDTGNAIF